MKKSVILVCVAAFGFAFIGSQIDMQVNGQAQISNEGQDTEYEIAVSPYRVFEGFYNGAPVLTTRTHLVLRTWDDGRTEFAFLNLDPDEGCSISSPCFTGWQTLDR